MWIDATVTAGYLYDPKQSQVADKVAFAPSPKTDQNPKASGWSWAWALGIPAGTKQADAAKKFVKWATSKEYVKMVGESEGWVVAPPGTRLSTYENDNYKKAAPFADFVLNAIQAADPSQADGPAGALHRCAVRGHPRIPGYSARRSARTSLRLSPGRPRATRLWPPRRPRPNV